MHPRSTTSPTRSHSSAARFRPRRGWAAEQSAKLCVQYLAPIIKNRQYNFPPLGENLFVGAAARPNEVTYSEDWLRPDYVPPQPNQTAAQPLGLPPLPAEVACYRIPADGLRGLMVPDGGGSMIAGVAAASAAALACWWLWPLVGLAGCGWRGLNSLPLPGTAGRGPGSFTIQAQLPDVGTLEQNSRVRVGDVTVGNVTKIERQGWHALLTMQAQRRRRPAGQRDRNDRPDQPARFAARRAGSADRRPAPGQAERRDR